MKSKYLIVLIFLLILINVRGFSQERDHKICLTLDVGGNSGGYSVSGEYKLLRLKNYNVNARLGFGYLSFKETSLASIPLVVNVLTGSKKHHIECGIGVSYIKGLSYKTMEVGNVGKYYFEEALYFVPSVGYRYDKLTKGLIFKVYYSPLVVIHDFLDKNKIMNDVTGDVVLSGTTTKEEYFNYFFGDNILPKATSKYGHVGISIGYRF